MPAGYNRDFGPYVVPTGTPSRLDMIPTPRWFAMMAGLQVRAAVGAGIRSMHASLPGPARSGQLGRALETIHSRLVGDVPGRPPSGTDADFAWRRFAGMNPMTIARVNRLDELPAPLQISDQTLSAVLGGVESMAARIARGDLFVLDLTILAGPHGVSTQPGKFVAPAAGLFCYAPELDTGFPVVPVAIACPAGRPDGTFVCVTPLEGARWHAARQILAVADVNFSELCLHLARAHFMTGPFALALHRCVNPAHPLYEFLLPHLRFDLFVEHMAWTQGVQNTDGILIRSLGGDAKWSQALAARLHEQYTFRDQNFERDLERRGLNDTRFDYPYRDDGRLLWAAISSFVEGFVHLTYPDDAALCADTTLHDFLTEVASPRGGNVRGLLAGAKLETRDELIEILTQVIFVAGPLHAVFHYGSASELQDPVNNPAYLLGNPLEIGDRALPGQRSVHQYTRVVSTSVRYGDLGDFSRDAFGKNPVYAGIIAEFAATLADIDATIVERNRHRYAPYIHLQPSRIPNGITV